MVLSCGVRGRRRLALNLDCFKFTHSYSWLLLFAALNPAQAKPNQAKSNQASPAQPKVAQPNPA